MIKGRDLSDLSENDDASYIFELIVSHFNENYLNGKSRHRIQQLWQRPDRLATVELYTLGKCLEKFSDENLAWLKGTIKRIRNEPEKAHGFFTEILYYGFFGLYKSKILPAQKKQPGYDFSVLYPNNTSQLISVKNIDISDYHKQTNARCVRLRRLWINHLKSKRSNLELHISSTTPLTENDFDTIEKTIKHLGATPSSANVKGIQIHTRPIFHSVYDLAPTHTSDIVFVQCPSPDSEKNRYKNRLKDAVANIKKHSNPDNSVSRIIFLRTHVSADYEHISEYAKNITEDPNHGIDAIIFYQPSYVRDHLNNSLLNHLFKIEVSHKLAHQMNGSDWFKVTPPIGAASVNQSNTIIEGGDYSITPSDFIFQEGDIYQLAKKDVDGSLYNYDMGSPAPGIRKHAVFFVNGGYRTFELKSSPKSDNLLII
ncbi:hypothetical protein [Pseudomonas sp. zfem005]|uniref:hypothetical protein n=1 Tax=Pseudomonas sp. zfem005 TaxID=3078200 RepID=UPI002927CAAA|nr:hypothetical protein [Pseudomonas sp. zfem005]MDU9414897.1 hypothetical protein [Pseudomonas sp. zfem005]